MSHSQERPLSPHLQVYKPQLTSMTSIFHRATGVALTAGLVLVAWVLVAAATGEQAYGTAMTVASSPLGQVALFGWSFALFYHMCNGVRHLLWDMGYLFKIENAYRAGYVVFLSAIVLTAGTWYCAKGNVLNTQMKLDPAVHGMATDSGEPVDGVVVTE